MFVKRGSEKRMGGRRHKQIFVEIDRRSGRERRSGFDRRKD